jgi:beta-lactam-binding protein with PASTA domain
VANKGLLEGQAKAVLADRGFPSDKVQTIKRVVSNPAQADKVIDQDPAEGTAKDPTKTIITLTIGEYVNPSPSASTSPSPP